VTPLLLAALGCGTPSGPEVLTSTPVTTAKEELFITVKDEVLRPDGRKPLVEGVATSLDVPGFEALEGEPRLIALSVANQNTGPCPVCMDEGIALSACVDKPGCENVPAVLGVVVSMAAEGQPFLAIAERTEWEDPWYAMPTDLPSRGEGRPLTVVVDYESPFSRDAEAIWSELDVTVHLLPWWGADREVAPLAAAAVASLDDPWALHAALLAEPLTEDRVRALAKEHGADIEAGMAEALRRKALADGYSVRGTPTVFLDGYRVRGLRPLSFYQERLAALP
jgi:hypothetical protein